MLTMERKRTSTHRTTILTDTNVEQDRCPKVLKLSLSDSSSKLNPKVFLFDANPHGSQAVVLSTLIRVTEGDISVYCSESLKALNHINLLWKSFNSNESICMVLLRIFQQLVAKCAQPATCVNEMIIHFISSKLPAVKSYAIGVLHQIATHFTLEKDLHQTALNVAQEHINSIHHAVRAACLNLIGQVVSASSDHKLLVAMVLHCLTDGDCRVRRAALEAMSTMATSDSTVLELSAYKEVSSSIYDDNEQVRIQAAKLLWRLGNLFGSKKITVQDSGVEINVLDDAFVKICDLMNDTSMKVRMLAAKLMGTFNGVTFKFLEQTLDKKLMSHLKHVKSDHERQRAVFQAGGSSNSMDWDSGKRWGQGIPQGGAVNKNEVVLMSQGACGAFVHGLEDEYMEVRKAAMESICQLSNGCSEFASHCVDFLVDMFNDEIEAVRLHSISCLCRVSSNITLRADHLEPVLNVLKDKSSDIREAVHGLLCSCQLTSTSGLRSTVDALLGNLSKYPQDKMSVWKCFKMIGSNHAHLTAALVPELLSTHPFFMTSEPDVDDPAYISVLVLIFNATQKCSSLLALFPSHVFRHYTYLNDALPDIVPQLSAMSSTLNRSCDPAGRCQGNSSNVTERFLSNTLDRIYDLGSCDAHQTIEMCISDLNQTASLDHMLRAPLHYVAMVCKCYLLLNKVKQALSQDIMLTTISPQRSVMATAIHNLEEVMSLSYQLQHCYYGQQAEMLCSVVQLRVITQAMQLLLAMQLNIDVTNSNQFMWMKESMAQRISTVSQFYSTSGCACPTALKAFTDNDIILMSPDALSNLLQPIINDDPPLCLQLSQLLPLVQARAEITEPTEGDGSNDCTNFVASLALLLHVRARLYNVAQLSRIAVRVVFPDHRQLFYKPKPSEVRSISATTDSLQASLVISHSAWTEPCQVEISIVQQLMMDSDEREADCLSRILSVNTATSPATIAAKDILYSEAIPLSKPVKLTILPKSDK